jgi:acetyltransferase-like isoleucine patch superfamily enzyme
MGIRVIKYFIKYFCLNIVCRAIPHPKLRAIWLSLLGARIEKNVRIDNVCFVQIQHPLSHLQCKDNVFIGSSVIIDLSAKITIDSNSLVSPGCSLITHQDPGDFFNSPLSKVYPKKYEPIHIHENVWVGCDSTILPGASIGRFSVIGAKSLVKGKIPECVLACGIPAQVKKILSQT